MIDNKNSDHPQIETLKNSDHPQIETLDHPQIETLKNSDHPQIETPNNAEKIKADRIKENFPLK